MAFKILVEEGIIHVLMSGTLTRADLLGIATRGREIETSLGHVPPRLADLTSVTEVEINATDVRNFAEMRRKLQFPNSFKSAIVVAHSTQFGYARMFQILNDHPQIVIGIFPDATLAREWIAEPGVHPPKRPWTPPLGQ